MHTITSAPQHLYQLHIYPNIQTFDGDGRAARKVAVNTILNSDPEANETTTKTTYLLRSSVLGGKVVSEIGSESEQRGFVYLGDEVLALQYRTTQAVKWEHRDAGNASIRMTSSNGTVQSEEMAELDPLGSNAGLSAPVTPSPAQYWKLSGYPGLGSPGTSMTCIMDFIPTPCTEVARAVNNGSAAQCPDNNCDPVPVIYQGKQTWAFFNAYGDGFQGYIPNGAVYTENGNFVARSADRLRLRTGTSNDTNFSRLNGATGEAHLARVQQVFHHPQKPQVVMVPIDADKLKSLIQERLDFEGCAKFVADLINKAAELTNGANPAKSTNIMDLFDEIRGQPKGGVLFQPSDAPHPHYSDLQLPAGGGGWAWGIYAQGNATINVPRQGYYSDRPSGAARIPYAYGLNGLHEVIHLSGRNGTYDDALLTRAANVLEPNAGIGTDAQAWGDALKNHCVPARYR